ncbi:MAG: hypothetical protein LBI53_07330 [Candidatus Peribacteria bacterium]|jgi:cell division protein FtsB|nr:hypothetical protein [Candidatus Peribacteria bacterium]
MEQKQKKFVNTQIPMTQKSKKHNVLATSLMISLGVAFGLAGIFLLNQAGVTRAQQQDITEGPFITGHDNVIQYVKEINFYNEAQEIVATMSANQADGTLLISGVDGIALAQQN